MNFVIAGLGLAAVGMGLGAVLSLPAWLILFSDEIADWIKDVRDRMFWWRWERRRRRVLRAVENQPIPESLRHLNERALELLGPTMVTCEEFGRGMQSLAEAMRSASNQWWRT